MKYKDLFIKQDSGFSKTYFSFKALNSFSIPQVIAGFIKKAGFQNPVDYLSIGCSDGQITFQVLHQLEGYEVKVDYLDPSPWMFKKFLKNSFFNPASFNLIGIEEFKFDRKYDVIEALQTLYDLTRDDEIIKKILTGLSEGGIAFFSLQKHSSPLYLFLLRFLRQYNIDILPLGSYEDLYQTICNVAGKEDFTIQKLDFYQEYRMLYKGKLTKEAIILLRYYAMNNPLTHQKWLLERFLDRLSGFSHETLKINVGLCIVQKKT